MAAPRSIDWRGGRIVAAARATALGTVRRLVRDAVQDARDHAPVLSGDLRDSIEEQREATGRKTDAVGRLGSVLPYARRQNWHHRDRDHREYLSGVRERVWEREWGRVVLDVWDEQAPRRGLRRFTG